VVTPAPGKATSYLDWSDQGAATFVHHAHREHCCFGSLLVGTGMDVVPSLAPLIIEDPSFNLVLGVTVFGAILTFVPLETLVRRRERFGKGSIQYPAINSNPMY
jgi:hypothetical protein